MEEKIKTEVNDMTLEELRELAYKTLLSREKTKLRVRKHREEKKNEREKIQ